MVVSHNVENRPVAGENSILVIKFGLYENGTLFSSAPLRAFFGHFFENAAGEIFDSADKKARGDSPRQENSTVF